MAVTELARHRLYQHSEQTMGAERATTLMELLPPVGWADVATTHDLGELRVAVKRDLEAFCAEVHSDFALVRAEMERDRAADAQQFEHVRSELRVGLQALRHELSAELHQAWRRHTFATVTAYAAMLGLVAGAGRLF